MVLHIATSEEGKSINLEPLTEEEQSLLDMYAMIKTCEREASKLREKVAKDRLAAADEKYQREQSNAATNETNYESSEQNPANNKKKKKKKKKAATNDTSSAEDEDDDNMSDVEGEDNDDDHSAESPNNNPEDKLLLELKKKRMEEMKKRKEEEELREQLLQSTEIENTADLGPSLMKKQRRDQPVEQSLIANLEGQATPPHDFSKTYELSRISGSVLFPMNVHEPEWTPPFSALRPDEGCLEMDLPDFDLNLATKGKGKNTIAIKFMAPQDAKRFSINIVAPNHNNYDSVLFHFNPRQRQKGGQLVINDKKDGIWGQGVNVPLSQVPLMFGQDSCTLLIQINGEGFDMFVEGKHCARLEHRTELPNDKCSLTLQFPSTDDYGQPENWTVYKVWWGHKPIMATGDVSGVAGVNSYNSVHPRKIFLSGFTKIFSEPEVDLRRAELERDFRKYGGALGAVVTVQTNSTFAFVELESEAATDLALVEMADKYPNRINRARRSRYEALQEERAAQEKAAAGTNKKEASEWD